jgi:hypothetical protein
VYTDYDPGLPDGNVQGDKLFHDTWDRAYRSPFGAVKAGDTVKLRLQAKKGDLTTAKVQLKNYNTGNTIMVEMEYAGWVELNAAPVEFWEADIKPEEKGVYGYKFIARDGESQKEYGEDIAEGGKGTTSDANASLFQLTVFDPAYKTPDWMKEAVVYQIFPDRFFNGNKKMTMPKIQHAVMSQLNIKNGANFRTTLVKLIPKAILEMKFGPTISSVVTLLEFKRNSITFNL